MPSPFPGMDPYLEDEKLWPGFHHQFINCLYQFVVPGLADRYKARLGQRVYTTEQALFTSVVREEHQEEYIEIRQRSDNRLITLLEVVSPANKANLTGRKAYLDKRREARSAGANLVEIDLVLQGQSTWDYSRDTLPPSDYTVTLNRSNLPDRYEICPTTLQKKLPRFKLPFPDNDVLIDLQTVFTRCFDQGGFAAKIDYKRNPPTKISDEDRQWIDQHLKQQKRR